MPYYNDEWLRELHSKINIEQIVSQYVQLKSKGGRLWGCCPFHTEKTPSFTVDTGRGFYHCFGCGKGGNALHFIMEMEHLTFPEACRYLGEKFGMDAPKNIVDSQYENKSHDKKRAYEINRVAAHFFYKRLQSKSGIKAKEYLLKRGIDSRLQKVYGIGYADDNWQGLLDYLKSKGYTDEELLDVGLAKKKEQRYYDIFRNRIMFPIINQYSQVIGFGGRVMDSTEPKYLNTPDTVIFNKRQNLYNINILKSQRNIQHVILVEGYMDAIALGKHGIDNCVATLGTALTVEQSKLIKRFTENIYISYDGDNAGLKAALRAIGIAQSANLNCRIIKVPDNEDPDEYLKKYGIDAYMKLLKNAKTSIEFQFDMLESEYDLSDDLQKENYTYKCIELLKAENSAFMREKYAEHLAGRTGYSIAAILRDVYDVTIKKPQSLPTDKIAFKNTTAVDEKNIDAVTKAENYIISFLCKDSLKIKDLTKEITDDAFILPVNKKVFNYLAKCAKNDYFPQCHEILSEFQDESERAHIVELLSQESNIFDRSAYGDSTLTECITKLLIRKKQAVITMYINKAKENPSADEKREIASKISALNKELYKLKSNLTAADV